MKSLNNIRKIIEDSGYLSVAEFMHEAMYNIQEGYYIANDPIGAKGDFITAPEISQLFGEMIGIFCADMWFKLGSPQSFNLVELGPGRGILMSDLLRATKNLPGFHQSCTIHLVETNKNLIENQKEKLAGHKCFWHRDINTIPDDKPLIIIANEFFDVLPINQYIRDQDIWYERSIAIAPKTEDFYFINIPIKSILNQSLLSEYPNAKNGSIVEFCYPAVEITNHITKILQKQQGCFLFIDYGYYSNPLERKAYNSTLQSVKNHKYNPIFHNIGQADLTAHVDFFAIKKAAENNFCKVLGTISQGEFLTNLGINIRADILKQKANLQEINELELGLERLISPNQMGELFKVMAIFSSDLLAPIGF